MVADCINCVMGVMRLVSGFSMDMALAIIIEISTNFGSQLSEDGKYYLYQR
jgi:hypothetical protein